MLTRRVLLVVRDPDGAIVGLCGDWGLTSKNTVVQELLTGSRRYYLMLDGERVDVRAVPVSGGYSLTASTDAGETNYLEQLPDG